ncbi:MAG TPA: hypothetical protein VK044_04180 [Virgibacillus sp.]|nr:hypothetical protein [Virgibacillus sp.]
MSTFLGVSLIIIAVYFLHKKGIIKNAKFPIIRFAYRSIPTKNKLTVSYKLYNGMEKHPFKIKKGEDTTLNYNVSVQSGSLILKFINDTYVVFEEEFTSDQQGSFSFTPSSRIQIITVIGNFTKGGCDVEIID